MPKALNSLKSSLTRVRLIADDVDVHAQDALKDPQVQQRHLTTLCAATVILSGFLESFLKEIAEEVIGDICGRSIPFVDLPDVVRVTHFHDGSNRVRDAAKKEKKQNPILLAKTQDLARRLASAGAVVPYELVWEAFADTQANPGPAEISDYLRRFDIDRPLPTLAAAIGVSETNLTLQLRSFIEIRNECAHTGTATINPTASDVRGYCDLIENIGAGVEQLLQTMLSALPYTPAQPPIVPGAPPMPAQSTPASGAPIVTTAGANLPSAAASGATVAQSGTPAQSARTMLPVRNPEPPLRNALRRFCDRLLSIFR